MDFEQVFQELQQFNTQANQGLPGPGCPWAVYRLEAEFERTLPTQLREWVEHHCPANQVGFEDVGNDNTLIGLGELGKLQPGYNFNTVTMEPIEGWADSWFRVGDEGGNPYIIDLNAPEKGVQFALIGAGNWMFSPVAESIPHFLLIAGAIEHALRGFGPEDPITDGPRGLNLADAPADWLFPRVSEWTRYGDFWLEAFVNWWTSKHRKANSNALSQTPHIARFHHEL